MSLRKQEKDLPNANSAGKAAGQPASGGQPPEENKLGTMAIGPLLVRVSVPIVISMLVQALYNIVDSIFVARYGGGALTAVSLVFPIQNLMIAVGVGTAVGVNSLLSRRLGEKNNASANRAALNGIFLALLSWVAFAVFGGFFSEMVFSGYAAHDQIGPEIAAMAVNYMKIVTVGSLGIFMSVTYERLLQSTGRSMFSMVSQLTGAVVNIILDPIMIFGLLGFPAMGVAGAALATIIGQHCSMVISIFCNHRFNKELHLRYRHFRPNLKTIKHIYQVGLPSIIMQSIGSVMVSAMNVILARFGATAVNVLGIYFKLQSFAFMPVFGFNNGMIPIVAYNYGAKNPRRIEKTIKMSVIICLCILTGGLLLFWLAPAALISLFNSDPELLHIGTQALRLISLSFPMAAVSIVFSGVFQALGRGLYSLIMSVIRQLVFLLPLAWLLSQWQGLNSIWLSFPISEVFSLAVAVFFFLRCYQSQIKPLHGGPQKTQAS